jgi:hypothetical protein
MNVLCIFQFEYIMDKCFPRTSFYIYFSQILFIDMVCHFICHGRKKILFSCSDILSCLNSLHCCCVVKYTENKYLCKYKQWT